MILGGSLLKDINKKFFLLAVNGARIGKRTDVAIAVRCPICGDSRKNERSTRLNLYTKSGYDDDQVSCFNGDCSCQNKTMYSFLRDFFPNLLEKYKQENFQGTMRSLAEGDVFESFKKEEPKTDIITQDFSSLFTPLKEVKEGIDYLTRRGYNYTGLHGEWYFGHQNLQISDRFYNLTGSIIIPLYYSGDMYGFYSRNIHDKNFSTYMNDSNVGYKIWNWFNVDKNKTVYISEGIFDSLSTGFDNIIAAIGAKIPTDRLDELKDPVFVLDNDRTGIINSLAYAKQGYKVYIQPEKYQEKDMNELKLNHKDLNIVDLIKENIFSGLMAEIRLKEKL